MSFLTLIGFIVAIIALNLIISMNRMRNNHVYTDAKWKSFGLWVSFLLLVYFWGSYILLLLDQIDPLLADIIWLGSGISGIVFGIINYLCSRDKFIRFFSIVMMIVGLFTVPIWLHETFLITTMH